MYFDHSDNTRALIAKFEGFMAKHVYPAEQDFYDWVLAPENLWQPWPRMQALQNEAKEQGLWNLFLPKTYGDISPGLTNLEYAPLAEIMGRVNWCAEVFNCSAPDTGNMELLAHYGTDAQKAAWLTPLLNGDMRSSFAMTEPAVASSDATNLETSILPDGDDYVINGRKWWITGIMDPRCKVLLVMGKTLPGNPRHQQHSTIIVPRDALGLSVVRTTPVFNNHNSPGGEAEIIFDNVRVPKANLILGEGRGFEIAQGRLGPGRMHHCMRAIGAAQRCLEIMARRVDDRVAFGRKLADQGSIRQDIAKSFCDIEQARLMTLKVADLLDRKGTQAALDLISGIKFVVPRVCQTVADRALQAHGAMGLSNDTPIANIFTIARYLRLADGPDEVHMSKLGKMKIREYCSAAA